MTEPFTMADLMASCRENDLQNEFAMAIKDAKSMLAKGTPQGDILLELFNNFAQHDLDPSECDRRAALALGEALRDR